MIFFNEETTYEYMAITKNEIVNTITVILDRLDNLENKTKKNKEFISIIRDRLLELNQCIDDILDMVSNEDEILFAKKMKQYSKMKSLFSGYSCFFRELEIYFCQVGCLLSFNEAVYPILFCFFGVFDFISLIPSFFLFTMFLF